MRFFGLHLTRTAGTSLADAAKRHLGAAECLMLSSFSELAFQNETMPQERDPEKLPLFAFGHYVHESLWSLMMRSGPVFSFTVVREPRERLHSVVRHMQRLGLHPDNIRQQLSEFPNPMCFEILRCLPLARVLYGDRPLHHQALQALSVFDRVCQISEMPVLLSELSARWGGQAIAMSQLNTAEADPGIVLGDFDSDNFNSEDDALWDAIQRGERGSGRDRVMAAVQDTYSDSGFARAIFDLHLDRFLVSEINALGTRKEFLSGLRRRQLSLDRLISVVEKIEK